MAPFFAVARLFTLVLYLGTLIRLFPVNHLVLGLGTGILVVSLHCLVFAIFTGAGKDTRLLVEDLSLSGDYVKRMKAFKFEVFPHALYGIGAVLVVTCLGGARSVFPGTWLAWTHITVAWASFFYNAWVFRMEYRAILENGRLLALVNQEASHKHVVLEPVEHHEWETHVYALGRFLTFLGYNTWLPYIYLHYIVGNLWMPLWPFLFMSATFFLGGAYLRIKYGRLSPIRR